MQVCKGLCLLCALSSPLKRRLRRKTGGNSSVPCRNGRASSPRHLSECKHLAAPSGSTERNVYLLLYLGLMRLSSSSAWTLETPGCTTDKEERPAISRVAPLD